MAALIRGHLDRNAYCLLLRNLEPVYRALEAGLVHNASHPQVAPVFFPGLFRIEALHLDLQALYGPGWEQHLNAMPASLAYARRLAEISQTSPGLLAAHAYVRYLGDLSGGQLLKSSVARILNPGHGDVGTAFYDFGAAADVAALAGGLRAGLDEIAASAAASDAIVAEAQRAFSMHCDLFDELAQAAALPIVLRHG